MREEAERRVQDLLKINPQKGEVGIEIEMEGVDLPDDDYTFTKTKFWTKHEDASLRGESGEWVLRSPVHRSEVQECLSELENLFRRTGSKLKPSDRCGVHVHLNFQDQSLQQILNFAILYYIVEDLLIHYCGDSREGNLFCLRARDAEYIIKLLRGFARNIRKPSPFGYLLQNTLKYSALNFSALAKYGSLEFRSLQTPADVLNIKDWVDLLLCLRDAALKFQNPREICEIFSSKGSLEVLSMIFGPHLQKIAIPMMDVLVFEGVRRIQSVAYQKSIDPVEEKKAHRRRIKKAAGEGTGIAWENIITHGDTSPGLTMVQLNQIPKETLATPTVSIDDDEE